MKRKRVKIAIAAAAALAVLGAVSVVAIGAPASDQKEKEVKQAMKGNPKNVIFFLGDGMGTQEITAARYYEGVHHALNVDRMPLTGFDTTWSVKSGPGPNYLPDYDPDSASTGTAWATGYKTIDERIAQGPSTAENVPGTNLRTVLERAQSQGMRVGDVSTAEITDATPAVLASHISLRGCQGPADMGPCSSEKKDVGGLGSIAEQEVDHKVDVLLGGGRGRFEQTITGGPYAGKNVIQSAQGQGYSYVSDAAGLSGISPVKNGQKPVLGLFNSGNMSLEWSGPTASLGKGNTPVPCEEGKRPANEPSLTAMTEKAIQLLDNKRGFFLQVEGASIDKQDHATNACGQLGETIAFDKAIGAALDWQETHPNTLIVVSADHSHTSQIVGEDASGAGLPTGYSTNLTTKDGQTLALTYGTAGGNPAAAVPPSQQHTGAVVPVWGRGPGALRVLGTNDETDLFTTLGG